MGGPELPTIFENRKNKHFRKIGIKKFLVGNLANCETFKLALIIR